MSAVSAVPHPSLSALWATVASLRKWMWFVSSRRFIPWGFYELLWSRCLRPHFLLCHRDTLGLLYAFRDMFLSIAYRLLHLASLRVYSPDLGALVRFMKHHQDSPSPGTVAFKSLILARACPHLTTHTPRTMVLHEHKVAMVALWIDIDTFFANTRMESVWRVRGLHHQRGENKSLKHRAGPVGVREFYMHASGAAHAHRTTFMAKMAKLLVIISSKSSRELDKANCIKAKKNYTKHWMNSSTEKPGKKVLGVQGPPETMPLWRCFEATIGGNSNWDIKVPSFPTKSSTRYFKDGTPGCIVRVGTGIK